MSSPASAWGKVARMAGGNDRTQARLAELREVGTVMEANMAKIMQGA